MKIAGYEGLNFSLTNRIPRRLATRIMGRFSKIEQPLIRDMSIATWRLFADLDLTDAKETNFRSVHHCFTRELRPGARTIDMDPAVLVSPCDAIIGAAGTVEDGQVLQVKGSAYPLADLLANPDYAQRFHNGSYVTLRLLSSMYHRFHAPYACSITSITHVPGDAWNVNPAALRRVDRLLCKNERVVIHTTLSNFDYPVALVAVAAILVSSVRLRCLAMEDMVRTGNGWQTLSCSASFAKGEEMGWFEQGSTILLFAPQGIGLDDSVKEGARIRMGQSLMRLQAQI